MNIIPNVFTFALCQREYLILDSEQRRSFTGLDTIPLLKFSDNFPVLFLVSFGKNIVPPMVHIPIALQILTEEPNFRKVRGILNIRGNR